MKRGAKDRFAPSEDKHEEISIGPEISPGLFACVRRSPDGEITQATCSPAKEGAPIPPGAEFAIADEATCDCGTWRKLTSVYKAGPAQVATPAYREGHDRIFGKKQKVGLA